MVNKQDILTAIKNLDLFLRVPALKGAKPRINKNGSPFAYVGGFNMVFQLTHNSKKWAFRVWHVPMGENKDRYLKISKFLTSKKLPYFAKFIYDVKGILVNGIFVDTIRMEWLDGILLKDYIEKHLSSPSVLGSLADSFMSMCQDLRDNQISHGDLQEGNILVEENGDIKLVDYDSVCVPEIEGQKELVTGLKGYQHPSRFKGGKTSLKADYFSELIIYLSLLGIAEKPELWGKYQVKDSAYLLFSENDFESFLSSEIYKDLSGLSPQIDILLQVLTSYLETPLYTELKPLPSYLKPPEIKFFTCDTEVLICGEEIKLSWEVQNSLGVSINNGIGKVSSGGSMVLRPNDNTKYILTANGLKNSVHKSIAIRIFPTPLIKSIQVPVPLIEMNTRVELSSPSIPQFEFENLNLSNKVILNVKNISNNSIQKVNFIELNNKKPNVVESNKSIFSFLQNLSFKNILTKINE